MRQRRSFVAAALLAGCASAPASLPTNTPVQAAAPEAAARPAELPPATIFDSTAPPRIETSTFLLELDHDADATTQEPTRIAVILEGRGGYHVNLEYPLRVALGASAGVTLEKATLAAGDATELSEARARFESRVHAGAAGEHWLAARVQFAVCTPDTCVPREEALAIALRVK